MTLISIMDFIEKILTSNGGAFAIVVALLGLAFWVVNKVSVIVANHNSFSGSVTDMKGDIKTINTDIAHLKGSFTALLANSNPLTQRHSPISLTEKGNEIAQRIGAVQMVSNNWENIYKLLKENMHSKNAYDIQQFCMEKGMADLSYFLNPSDLDTVKLDAFNTGFTLANYGGLFGVIVRDKYFSVEKIPLGDVDRFDPSVSAK